MVTLEMGSNAEGIAALRAISRSPPGPRDRGFTLRSSRNRGFPRLHRSGALTQLHLLRARLVS
jgi:hypothetical protein